MIWSTESIYKLFVTCSVLVVNTSYELITGFRVTGPILCDIMICTYIVSSIHLLLIKQRGLCLSSRTCASKVIRLKVQIFPSLSLLQMKQVEWFDSHSKADHPFVCYTTYHRYQISKIILNPFIHLKFIIKLLWNISLFLSAVYLSIKKNYLKDTFLIIGAWLWITK